MPSLRRKRLLLKFPSSNDDGDSNENGKNTDRFILAKQQLCTSITLFLYISLPSLQVYKVNAPKFTFYRGREQKTVMISLCYFCSNASRDQSINSYVTEISWLRPGALMISDLKHFDVALTPLQTDATFNNE